MQDGIRLDSLHVVSDLHLGGAPGFQIFGSTQELAWLISHVAEPRPGRHGLVINGDFIDFLAEAPSMAFDPLGAAAKLDSIWNRFEPVFEALRRLVQTPERLLIINLGNHDLELALPWVRSHLAQRLTDGDETATARLLLVTDGTGVNCQVGSARVVCLHGNEVDAWNVADYEQLRRIARDHQLGRPLDAWLPNAGSRMVVEVMNGIKRRYPFVDLLKPETEAVLPLLAALDAGVYRKLMDLASIAGRRGWDAARMRTGFLDEALNVSEATPPPVIHGMPSFNRSSRELLGDVEKAWRGGVKPIDLVRGVRGEQLGFWSAARDAVTGTPRHEVVRQALEQVDRDRSFDPGAEDDTFRDLDALVGADVDVIVAGHTHLERSLKRRRGGHYFNTGTWARLIRILPALRQDAVEFEKLFKLLDGSSLAKLDEARLMVNDEETSVVLRLNTVALIETGAGGTHATLQHVLPAAAGKPIRLEKVAKAKEWTGG